MAIKLTIRSKLFLSHLIAVLLVSGSIGTYFSTSAYKDLKVSLQNRLRNSAVDDCIQSAGVNLHTAKRQRRNRVVAAESPASRFP